MPPDELALPHRSLFTCLGVPWKLTPKAWLFLPTRLAFGLVVAFVFLQSESVATRLFFGAVYALLLLASQSLHIIGHTLSGQWVDAPMTANLIEDRQITTYYANDPPDLPARVHLGRTAGGPLMNFVVASLACVTWQIQGGHVLLFMTLINLFLASMLFLPFKEIDGEIFWRALRRKRSPARPDTSRPK
jgi:hypothetical protein